MSYCKYCGAMKIKRQIWPTTYNENTGKEIKKLHLVCPLYCEHNTGIGNGGHFFERVKPTLWDNLFMSWKYECRYCHKVINWTERL